MPARTQFNRVPSIAKALFTVFLIALLFSQCNTGGGEIVEINFARSNDGTTHIEDLVDKFNKEHKGDIKVNYVAMARLSDDFYSELAQSFESGTQEIDVLAADVVWTPSFASNGWVEDLSADFYDNFDSKDFVGASLNSAIYDYKVWGIPWYTDAGMLFYRKDLLEKSGFTNPPRTWGELATMAQKVQEDSGTKHGLVLQGDDYEGGVTNAVEFIWNAGGNIMIGDLSVNVSFDEAEIDPNIITVNDMEAMQGLTSAYDLIKKGVVSQDVTNMRELECQNAFNNGEAVFMRNWPTSYGLIDQKGSQINTDQVGIAAIPSLSEELPQYSCLGGWNLMISSKVSLDKKDAAWRFIKFLVEDKQQSSLVKEVGALPTMRKLYDDSKLIKSVPVMELAKDILKNTRSRPVSPYYMEISPLVSSAFKSFLKGEKTSYETAEALASQLEEVMAKYR